MASRSSKARTGTLGSLWQVPRKWTCRPVIGVRPAAEYSHSCRDCWTSAEYVTLFSSVYRLIAIVILARFDFALRYRLRAAVIGQTTHCPSKVDWTCVSLVCYSCLNTSVSYALPCQESQAACQSDCSSALSFIASRRSCLDYRGLRLLRTATWMPAGRHCDFASLKF